jgi:hypothetical protein
MYIGISGLAGVGKDLFLKLFSEEISKLHLTCKRFALADELKNEINPILLSKHGINIFSCSREQKETVRHLLVSHAKIKREQTSGRYWINKLEEKIEREQKPIDFVCITDIRYDEYENDEVSWLKNEKNGILVHISKYKEVNGKKMFQNPPNDEEARNDPKLKSQADYKICWPHMGENSFNPLIRKEILNFSKWISIKHERKQTTLENH